MGLGFSRTREQAFPDQKKNSGKKTGAQYDFCCLGIASKVLYRFLPGGTGGRSCADKKEIPQKASKGRHPEKTFKVHFCHSCRYRDKTSDNRNKTAEKYCVISLTVKPVRRLLKVFFF